MLPIKSPAQTISLFSMKYVLENTPIEKLPFNATKNWGFPKGYNYPIDNSNKKIPEKLYDNVQLTQYTGIDSEQRGEFFRKFLLPSGIYIVVVSFGGASDWRTDVLCTVDKEGNVLSTLEGMVRVMDITVKQYRIAENGSAIYISRVVPSSSTSLRFENISSFSGYIETVGYSIKDGKFSGVTSVTSQTKTFTKNLLSDPNVNLWEY